MTTEQPAKIPEKRCPIGLSADLCIVFLKKSRLSDLIREHLVTVVLKVTAALGPRDGYQGPSVARAVAAYDKLREIFASFAMARVLGEGLQSWPASSETLVALIDDRFAYDYVVCRRLRDVISAFDAALSIDFRGADNERIKGIYRDINLLVLFIWEARTLESADFLSKLA